MREDALRRLEALKEAGREKKRIVLSQDDLAFLASLPQDEYEAFKLDLYSFAFLNSWKIIPEETLDKLVNELLLRKLNALTARPLTEFIPSAPAGLLMPPGFVIEAGCLFLDPREALGAAEDEGLVRKIAEPAVYLEKFIFSRGTRKEVYIATFREQRRIELKPTDVEAGKILPSAKNAGVRLHDPWIFFSYILSFRDLNWQTLSENEMKEAEQETSALPRLLDALREAILRQKVEVRTATLRCGERVLALWPLDFQRLAKSVGLTDEQALQALADARILVLSAAGEKKRPMAVGAKRVRMVVLREGALFLPDEDKIVEIPHPTPKEQRL
ncbi:hypothetical protein [Desulfothermobacter acidiphilus]|uniref:hypothetical protein n=1 Tax=Desulfothermobacter acidiphilus TaxID=1938353 RepID=UPI003F8880DF